jgi:hypothetical protein
MKVTKVYKEDGCILVEVSGWPEALILPNHHDNRRFMREFDRHELMYKETLLDTGCTVGELKSIGFELKDYDGYHYLEKNCTIEVTGFNKEALRWNESRKGNFWTAINCNVKNTGLCEHLTKDVHSLLHKKSYDKNPNILEGETYSGVCKAMVYGYGEVIEDDYKLNHVNFTMFPEDPMSTIAKDEFAKLLKEVCNE